MRKRPHHQKSEVSASRPNYREARWERAVKAYTVNQESRYLLILNVPAINVDTELTQLCTQFSSLSCKRLEDYPREEFTEAFLVVFRNISAGRIAKRKLDNRSFFGSQLHVTYAPEQETVDDTRAKLQQRRQDVISRLAALERERGEASGGKPTSSADKAKTGQSVSPPAAPTVASTACTSREAGHVAMATVLSTSSTRPPPQTQQQQLPPQAWSRLPMQPPPPPPPPASSTTFPPPHVTPGGWSSSAHGVGSMPYAAAPFCHLAVSRAPHIPNHAACPPPLPPHSPGYQPHRHSHVPPPSHPQALQYPSMDPNWANPRPLHPPAVEAYSLETAAQNLGAVQGPRLPTSLTRDSHSKTMPATSSSSTASANRTNSRGKDNGESVDTSVQAIRSRMAKAVGPSSTATDLAKQMGMSKKRRRI
ncbi:uncharacterized protein LOC135804974 isoform X2 [Sycon ciliatum]|uniref:uncharacterized protein LOC135804974 isoform X2 n=1 Tax=Sycon ciliatum TaxID=27933 RepID=UPI0031F6783D